MIHRIQILIVLLLFSRLSYAQWSNGQPAEHVIGQADFAGGLPGVDTVSFSLPVVAAIDVAHGKMYVADSDNSRILRFAYPVAADRPAAELVIGQLDFESRVYQSSDSTLKLPFGLAVHNGDLWVADPDAQRVLCYRKAYSLTRNGPKADVVIGQADFTSSSSGVSAGELNTPSNVGVDSSGNLWVVDGGNARLLRYPDAATLANNADANLVLGQPDFTTVTRELADSNSMTYPIGIAFGANVLFVADNADSRVLRFDNVSTLTNGRNADAVFGQVNFTDNLQNQSLDVSAAGLFEPKGLAIDAIGNLYVADYHNCRVLVYANAASLGNGPNADYVIGEPDFLTNDGGTSADLMLAVSGVAVDNVNNLLLVTDFDNNRVLEFLASDPLPITLAALGTEMSNGTLVLHWTTASEVKNYGFTVQRRIPGERDYADIAGSFQPGHGTTVEPHAYRFGFSGVPPAGTSIRLKQQDLDGRVHYSDPILIPQVTSVTETMPIVFALFQNFPNPFNPETEIEFMVKTSGPAVISIHNVLGQQVATVFDGQAEPGRVYHGRFSGKNLPSGVYVYRLESGADAASRRMMLLR